MRRSVFATLILTLALVFARTSSAEVPTRGVQPTIEDAVRTVDMPTVLNARDLGGLHGSKAFIPHGVFYRSATLAHASDEDRKVLLGRGVTFDIDLRTYIEAEAKDDRLSHDSRFGYRRISLLGVGVSDWF